MFKNESEESPTVLDYFFKVQWFSTFVVSKDNSSKICIALLKFQTPISVVPNRVAMTN